jgi:hypothetical protein
MIRLLTVIGHGINLIEHHIKHYERYVDEIQYVVYETDLHPTLFEDVKKITEQYNNVKIVKTIYERVFDWYRVTKLYNEIKLTKPNDWWVVADIDEFHLYPEDDLKYVISNNEKNGWDIIRGGFIDRIGKGGEFSELVDNVLIWEQFPNAGFFRYPMSNACPNKICIMKGYIELTGGQHYAKINGETTWKWQGWNHPLINSQDTVQVHHFKWDKTSINRIKLVADNNQEYSHSIEYDLMYKSLKETNFKIDLLNPDFMFEFSLNKGEYNCYRNWNKLINKIKSI